MFTSEIPAQNTLPFIRTDTHNPGGRRGFISTLGGLIAAAVALPLLPAQQVTASSRDLSTTPRRQDHILELRHGNAFFD